MHARAAGERLRSRRQTSATGRLCGAARRRYDITEGEGRRPAVRDTRRRPQARAHWACNRACLATPFGDGAQRRADPSRRGKTDVRPGGRRKVLRKTRDGRYTRDGASNRARRRSRSASGSRAVDVVRPQDVGDVGRLVVGAGRDTPGDRGVRDVNALVGELVVQHARVGDLAGERDPDARAQRIRVDRRAARREEDRAAAGLAHRAEDRPRRGDGAEDAELERPADVVDRRLEDRLHELARGQRRVLEHLDGAEPLGRATRSRQRARRVADVRGRARGGDAVGLELRGEVVELGLRRARPARPRGPRGRSAGRRRGRGSGLLRR